MASAPALGAGDREFESPRPDCLLKSPPNPFLVPSQCHGELRRCEGHQRSPEPYPQSRSRSRFRSRSSPKTWRRPTSGSAARSGSRDFGRARCRPASSTSASAAGYVLNEALPGALDRFYGQALEQEQIAAISSPEDVDVKEFNDGEQLIFTAEVDVRPEVDAPRRWTASRSPSTTSRSPTRTSTSSCESLRDRFATLQPVERPSQDGDYLTLDLSATIDGEPVPDSESKGHVVRGRLRTT